MVRKQKERKLKEGTKRLVPCVGELCFNADGSITIDVSKSTEGNPECRAKIIDTVSKGTEVNFKLGKIKQKQGPE